ncbi:NAD(P)H nitroreductase [Mycobacterium sp. CBMA293]|uniref:Acg family FMN-binding oxidoreductase n=1 Tax=unclassified Mycolicibacterium TaxID=2636767 RepID=UPI0012DDF033|nr:MULTISPECIES: NAD(P)H nitroreductase [unclassified Mycolicibacterium]MUL47127.1 NAD(P)H nitroreductase [Mycolicibacterium sp. CBMA 360]MUL58505.1 NAD(P)H nitroreductase [Mycolicibacterium sp. CBMA 335]MUL73963.1 NAD(P)H nitroreductase [Mycolicibacterium sp. CBMA 311]MUL93388.1 NAD(P)H nitroreductase [Mycolicibacterium sp. CBMA 230]MUM04603.1 NAD(P)H nitroreductase [Mycolicibacterium sp. CBMA 213]
MSSTFPDQETIRAAMALATRAPSVHNTQPWRWRIGTESVHLYAESSLHLIHTDPDGRDLLISCGAALHHAAVALYALGWQPTVHRFPNPAEPNHLAAIEVAPCTPQQPDIALAAAIPRRRTDRRYFSGWPVALGDIALMTARAARLGIGLRRVRLTDELTTALRQSVSQHVRDREYLDELTIWSGRYASVAGVPARSTPEPDQSASIPSRIFAGPALAQPAGATADDDNGSLLALGTSGDTPIDRLRAGEATSAVLLTATAQGLATCPVTEALENPQCRATVRTDVFGDELFPQMLIRVGWAPLNADPLPATPRRPLTDVVSWLDDGTPII